MSQPLWREVYLRVYGPGQAQTRKGMLAVPAAEQEALIRLHTETLAKKAQMGRAAAVPNTDILPPPPDELTNAVGTVPTGAKPKADGPLKRNVDYRVTKSNDVWWKYAWRVSMQNSSQSRITFSGQVEFQDRDGFIIDTDNFTGALDPMSSEVFTGFTLIRTAVAGNVKTAALKARMRQ